MADPIIEAERAVCALPGYPVSYCCTYAAGDDAAQTQCRNKTGNFTSTYLKSNSHATCSGYVASLGMFGRLTYYTQVIGCKPPK